MENIGFITILPCLPNKYFTLNLKYRKIFTIEKLVLFKWKKKWKSYCWFFADKNILRTSTKCAPKLVEAEILTLKYVWKPIKIHNLKCSFKIASKVAFEFINAPHHVNFQNNIFLTAESTYFIFEYQHPSQEIFIEYSKSFYDKS